MKPPSTPGHSEHTDSIMATTLSASMSPPSQAGTLALREDLLKANECLVTEPRFQPHLSDVKAACLLLHGELESHSRGRPVPPALSCSVLFPFA